MSSLCWVSQKSTSIRNELHWNEFTWKCNEFVAVEQTLNKFVFSEHSFYFFCLLYRCSVLFSIRVAQICVVCVSACMCVCSDYANWALFSRTYKLQNFCFCSLIVCQIFSEQNKSHDGIAIHISFDQANPNYCGLEWFEWMRSCIVSHMYACYAILGMIYNVTFNHTSAALFHPEQ